MSAAPSSADVFQAAALAPVDHPVEGKLVPINVMTRVHTEEWQDRWARLQDGRVKRVVQLVPVVHQVQEVRYIDENGDMQ